MKNRLTQFEFLEDSPNEIEERSANTRGAVSTGLSPRETTRVLSINGSPSDHENSVRGATSWKDYKVDARVKLDVWVLKAVCQDATDRVVAIRTFPKEGSDRIFQRYKQIEHQHLVSASAIFFTDDPQEYMCVVSEYLPFCLDHIAACSTRPSDKQLASMMGQILAALDHLHALGLVHGSLKCSSALVTWDGVIKIADFRDAQISHAKVNEAIDIKAAGHVMMEMMHGKPAPDDTIGVRDSHRGVDVMEFLAGIDLGLPASKLLMYPFLAYPDGTAKWTFVQLQNFLINTSYWSQVNYIRIQSD
ncbi:kinase-like domain-containing protein [Aspergillus pseudoustus]|uniref:Kinase-like domain-containing protein n=1 Tax=Aspergillus pseudoustus TaxID=1810923 RepID=A0ABR4J9A3_9EURO